MSWPPKPGISIHFLFLALIPVWTWFKLKLDPSWTGPAPNRGLVLVQ
jgi:hypothetical protein